MKAEWITRDDSEVRHVWACNSVGCPKQGEEVCVSPEFFQVNASQPHCYSCERAMRYLRTEVSQIAG